MSIQYKGDRIVDGTKELLLIVESIGEPDVIDLCVTMVS